MHCKYNDFNAQFQILLKVYICVIVRLAGKLAGICLHIVFKIEVFALQAIIFIIFEDKFKGKPVRLRIRIPQ